MKLKKHFTTLALVGLLSIIFSFNLDAKIFGRRGERPKSPGHHFRSTRAVNPGPTIGAPIGGGLLALFAGAGLIYFVARRKNKDT